MTPVSSSGPGAHPCLGPTETEVGGWDHSSCLESLYTLSLYDELSAAVGRSEGAQIND